MRAKALRFIIAFFLISFFVSTAYALIGGKVEKANKLYEEGKYDEALKDYDDLIEKRPESPVIEYNRAATLYRKKSFKEAIRGFLRALAGEKENLEDDAFYNIGNSKFRIGESQENKNPKLALNEYNQTLEYYKRAMEADPLDQDAKFNYEFTLKRIKDLKERQQQQKKQDQKDQKDQQQQQQRQKDQDKQDQKQDQQDQDKQDQKQDQQKEKQDQKQDQQDQDKQDQDQKDQEEQQDQKQKEEQQEDQKPQTPEESGTGKPEEPEKEGSEFPTGGKPDTIEGPSGEMTKEEAEMLLRGQEEEEARLRAEKRKARRGGRPPVVRDW